MEYLPTLLGDLECKSVVNIVHMEHMGIDILPINRTYWSYKPT